MQAGGEAAECDDGALAEDAETQVASFRPGNDPCITLLHTTWSLKEAIDGVGRT